MQSCLTQEKKIKKGDFMKDFRWASLGCGVIANQLAQAMEKKRRKLYAVANRTHEKAVLFAEEIAERGLVPLIAHPERYPTFHEYPAIVPELYGLGARFQVDADSLTGRIGESVGDFAVNMLTNGFADVIATDAHGVNHRKNDIQEMKMMFPPVITPEILRYTTETVPLYILKNEPLPRNPFRK